MIPTKFPNKIDKIVLQHNNQMFFGLVENVKIDEFSP